MYSDEKIKIPKAEFYITNVCNLTCSRCNRFNDHAFKGWQKWSDYEQSYKNWSEKIQIDQLVILGGEPLLNPSICQWIAGINSIFQKGVIGYVFLLIGTILKRKTPEDRILTLFLFAIAYGGLGFSLYLTAIEATILHAWCLICIGSQLMMLAFAVFVSLIAYKENHFSPIRAWFKKLIRR